MKKHEARDDAVLSISADYVLELLSEEQRTSFEEHLGECPICRDEVDASRALAGTLSEPLAPGPDRPGLWSRVEQRLGFAPNSGSEEPQQAADGGIAFQFADADPPWEPAPIPGVETRILLIDRERDRVTYEARLEPGSSYPVHEHHGPEECYVLAGDLRVGDVQLKAGDYQSLDANTSHGVQSTEGGCDLLLVSCVEDSPLAWAS